MPAYKTAAKIEPSGELRLHELPFAAGEEVEVIIQRKEPEPEWVQQLPPVTRSLLGAAQGVEEGDYHRYLEEKYR
jgi:hypothetical protein